MANVFIVDDSKISRRILRSILEENGHVVVGEAVNGKEAVDNFEQSGANVITLDITMPVMDGIEALKLIKAKKPEIVAIMITAAGQNEKVKEAIRSGASEFLSKPFDAEQILVVLKNILNTQE